jgi:hypothetical protein
MILVDSEDLSDESDEFREQVASRFSSQSSTLAIGLPLAVSPLGSRRFFSDEAELMHLKTEISGT